MVSPAWRFRLADSQRIAEVSHRLVQMETDVADGQPSDLSDFAVAQSGLQPQTQDLLLAGREFADQLVQMNLVFGVTGNLRRIGRGILHGHLGRIDRRRVIGSLHVDYSASADGK